MESKPGYKTTEFWVTIIVQILGIATLMGYVTPEQQSALDGFRQQLVSTRKELRSVQHELQKNIESLDGIVKFLNIGLMPLVIVVGGLVTSAYKAGRRRKGKFN